MNFLWTFLLLILGHMLLSQDSLFEARKLFIERIAAPIDLDGRLDDAAWQDAARHGDFWVQSPEDGRHASVASWIQAAYDDDGIWIAARMHDPNGQLTTTLKRDRFSSDDGFGVVIDPTAQKTNGFAFGVNVQNAQSEVLVSPNDVDASWDNRWRSATYIDGEYWSVEMHIPFSSLRFEKGADIWGINFFRYDRGLNEIHVWSPVPRQFSDIDLGYCGRLIWAEAPSAASSKVALIPYATARRTYDPQRMDPTEQEVDIGGDAKIAITPSLNLDLTINPDFSQVDVDQFQTNLTRFDIFFPERRQFFLENGDLFSEFGQFGNQPFYSRRIGLDASGNTVPILYGARITGNLTDKLRIGAFNMHSKTTDNNPGQNFTSVATQYRIGQRSSIKGLLLNRQAYEGSESISGDYGRNLGGEVNLSTNDGKWAGQLGLIHSIKDGITSDQQHVYGRFQYSGEQFRTFLFVQQLGRDYYADMGFNARINNYDPITDQIIRIGYTHIGNMLNYYIYPESDQINFHWSGIENFVFINEGNDLNEWYTRFRHFIFFQNSSELKFRLNHHYRELIYPFGLTEVPLPVGEYDNWEFNIQYDSDQRKDFNFGINSIYGEFFNGQKWTNIMEMRWRRQPWGNFSLGIENNLIRLPEPHGDLDITLLSASAEINFSTSLFWTTFFQFNTQTHRMNFNTRLQWRYASMSDLFIVYTDDYSTLDGLRPKGRSLVIKANYWLSI